MGERITAPYLRASWHRGVRGYGAALLALAAVVYVATATIKLNGSQTTSGDGSGIVWSQSGFPGNVDGVSLLATLALLACSAALWRAGSRRSIASAVTLATIVVVAAGLHLTTLARDRAWPAAVFNAIPIGTPRAEVLARLGRPLANNARQYPGEGGRSLSCLVYRVRTSPGVGSAQMGQNVVEPFQPYVGMCFSPDGLVTRAMA
jgi:hypothetical protein